MLGWCTCPDSILTWNVDGWSGNLRHYWIGQRIDC